eukprot:gene13981-14098_t
MNIYSVLNRIEKLTAYSLGKGYGATTVAKEVKLLGQLLKDPKLGIDIGGNIGDNTAALKQNYKNMEIHIFEPSGTNVQKLKTRFRKQADILINPLGLSNATGKAQLFSNEPGSVMGSLTKRKLDHFHVNFDIQESVELIRFEDYWRAILAMKKIDIAKIDVEGHELDVLNGFGNAIYQTQDFWYFFKEHHFKLYRITPFGLTGIPYYEERDESFVVTNYLGLITSFIIIVPGGIRLSRLYGIFGIHELRHLASLILSKLPNFLYIHQPEFAAISLTKVGDTGALLIGLVAAVMAVEIMEANLIKTDGIRHVEGLPAITFTVLIGL